MTALTINRHLAISRDRWAVLLYLSLAGLSAATLITQGRPWAALALVPAIFGPWGIVASTALMRLAYIGVGTVGDQPAITDAARERVLSGLSPYGVTYPQGILPDTPFPYGPLALLDSIPLEIVASMALAVLLVRRPLTLAVYAGLPFSLFLASSGNNDYVPTLALAAGLMVGGWRGAALVGVSAAWKPYTAVFLPAVGWPSLLAGLAVMGIGYLPAAWWGGLPESVALMERLNGSSVLRWLAVPFALFGLRFGILAGCAAFVALTMTGPDWSTGYFIPLIVAAGIALEPVRPPSGAR